VCNFSEGSLSSRAFARRPAKQRTVAEWQISRVAKKAIYLGKVEAADAETAIKAAIKKFDIDPEY